MNRQYCQKIITVFELIASSLSGGTIKSDSKDCAINDCFFKPFENNVFLIGQSVIA
jgi:hypothetical protein